MAAIDDYRKQDIEQFLHECTDEELDAIPALITEEFTMRRVERRLVARAQRAAVQQEIAARLGMIVQAPRVHVRYDESLPVIELAVYDAATPAGSQTLQRLQERLATVPNVKIVKSHMAEFGGTQYIWVGLPDPTVITVT